MGRHNVPWPAAPALNQTIILFTTHPKIPTGGASQAQPVPSLEVNRVNAVEIVWHLNDQASAANGIRVYALGSTDLWRETDVKDDAGAASIGSGAAQAVGILAAGAERRILIDVSRYRGVAIEYTGATAPTAVTGWDGTITVHLGVEALLR
jgi:hypothetical protein